MSDDLRSVASGSPSHDDDDDGFVLPAFTYAVTKDAFQPAPWEPKAAMHARSDCPTTARPSPSPAPKTLASKMPEVISPANSVLSSSSTARPKPHQPDQPAPLHPLLQPLIDQETASSAKPLPPRFANVMQSVAKAQQPIALPISESSMRDLESLMPPSSLRSPIVPRAQSAQCSAPSVASIASPALPFRAAHTATTTAGSEMSWPPSSPTAVASAFDPLIDLHSDSDSRPSSPAQTYYSLPPSDTPRLLVPTLTSVSPSTPAAGPIINDQGGSSEYPSTRSDFSSSYQDSVSDRPAPFDTSSVSSSPRRPPQMENMLNPAEISFDYLQTLLRKGDVFVRVEGPKSNPLVWTGNADTSGYFGLDGSFKDMGPEAFQVAARAAGLDRPNWHLEEYLWRSMNEHLWADHGDVPANSPWISATSNLDWAVWRAAKMLTSTGTVNLTFIRPTSERYSMPTPPPKSSQLTKSNSEVLFFGRIFGQSIIARVKFTRTDHNWKKARALLYEPGRLSGWTTQPIQKQLCVWPPTLAEEESTDPPSSAVGPLTPEPTARPQTAVSSFAAGPSTRKVVDLIDFEDGEDLVDSGGLDQLSTPLSPDKVKEYDLIEL